MENQTENQMGYQPVEEVKPKLGWNWGAFINPIGFGFGNKAYLTLLTLVPILSIVWFFICGAQGAKWAYQNNTFKNVDEFNGAMTSWNRMGLVMFIIAVVSVVLCIFSISTIIALITAFIPQ